MSTSSLVRTLLLVCLLAPCPASAADVAPKPNLVYILCDDLGYGDVHCLNPERGKIATPHIDRLASQGMVFTNAHSGSSVCTPTRYGILTGRYAWRTALQSGVLSGNSPPLIAADRLTVPALFQKNGYATACIGKWHLGLELPAKNLADKILQGPTTRGFDHFFGISASLDMPPFAWIENDHYPELPTATKQWLRRGPAAPGFEAVDVEPTLVRQAVSYIEARAAAKTPFFLYLPLTSPHTPILPAAEWKGKSGLGEYGDFVMQTDRALGQIMEALDKSGVADTTLLVFTSDNGCSPAANVKNLEKKSHFPSAQFRGYKADIWEGGHRVPFVARWPGVVKPGSECHRLVCLVDLMATSAAIVSEKLPDNAGEDSVSLLPLLQGENREVRDAAVHHSIQGMFALRQDKWKLIFGAGSGGWSEAGPDRSPLQLYDMEIDPGETHNLRDAEPAQVARLSDLMRTIIDQGRSTPGAPQKNDVTVKNFTQSPAPPSKKSTPNKK